MNLTSPVTGAVITGLTAPTYTLTPDLSVGGGVTKGWYVSALGGTQPGVVPHTIASPFTISWKNPAVLFSPGVPDVTGVYRGPTRRNVFEMIVRKGGLPLANQNPRLNMARLTISDEAGVETADPLALAAMLSLMAGALTQASNSIFETMKTGVA